MNFNEEKKDPGKVAGTRNDILAYLDQHGTRDKDLALYSKKSKPAKPVEKSKKGITRAILDLHGKTSDEALYRIRSMLEYCDRHAIKEVLVIHGRGSHSPASDGPVLKNMVHAMLENELALVVRSYKTALPRDGGDGATVVYLK